MRKTRVEKKQRPQEPRLEHATRPCEAEKVNVRITETPQSKKTTRKGAPRHCQELEPVC